MKYKVGRFEFDGDEPINSVAEKLEKAEDFEELKRETWRKREPEETKTAQEIIDEVEDEE